MLDLNTQTPICVETTARAVWVVETEEDMIFFKKIERDSTTSVMEMVNLRWSTVGLLGVHPGEGEKDRKSVV